MNSILLLATLLIPLSHAQAGIGADSVVAKLLTTKSEVTLNGTSVHAGDSLRQEGVLKTSAGGAARLELLPSHTILMVGAASEIQLKRAGADGTETTTLNSGLLRAQVQKKPSATKPVFFIRTSSAVMGVRGTDFLGIATPFLGESEIVVFSGAVDFSSAQVPTDVKTVNPGFWGGIGGRFGSQTHELIHLPESALKHFQDASEVK